MNMNRFAIALGLLISVTVPEAPAQNASPMPPTSSGQEKEPIDRQKMNNITKQDARVWHSDPHSHARPEEAVVTHIDLDLHVHFDSQRIKGTATYKVRNNGADMLVMDTRGLEIANVTDGSGNALKHRVEKPDSIKGSALVILIGKETERVQVTYATTDASSGLQWLTPGQNDGKTPFLYSQGQAILTRSWIPIQDSPAIRITYSAKVTVPAGMTAVMGALGNPSQTLPGQTVFEFKQPNPIPPYLIALAVGQLEFKQVSERTGIYAHPDVLPVAINEFADLEKMLAASEKLCGPYVWERFDVLVLPPSFPFGGMENPMLTFATPTILAGDRSLVSLIIHELAHSWSGNLVTNANWDDFWLNEGWTVYLERRIVEMLYGKEMADMMEVLGFQDLKATIADMPKGHSDTGLSLKLKGRDPDDGMTDVAYERGAMVIKEIELAWGREAFDRFIPHYFESFRFQSITTERFIGFVADYAEANGLKAVPLREMVTAVGDPKPSFKVFSDRLIQVEKARVAFLTGRKLADYGSGRWTAQERQYFLRILKEDLKPEQMDIIEDVLGLKEPGNSEVDFEWFLLCIRNDRMAEQPRIAEFLTRVGRRKFVLPLYKEMFGKKKWADFAKELYAGNRGRYHAITSGSVDRLPE